MAGETLKTEAICLEIWPWSRTSHIVSWLTPEGKISTVVKGAVRAKSQFLGQYDLNYTCDILYYARAKGELHALRECVPVKMRETLREDYRKLALAGYFRRLIAELAPTGTECEVWFERLGRSLDRCASTRSDAVGMLSLMLQFELDVLKLSGLRPDFSKYDRTAEWSSFSLETGSFGPGEGRCIRISREVAEYLSNPEKEPENSQIPLDAERVVGVFYKFHLDCAGDVRRIVRGMLAQM